MADERSCEMHLVPITQAQAKKFVAKHHRHSKPPWVSRFQVGLEDDAGELVGVAVAGIPSARRLCDGHTIEITRLCTIGERNAPSMLYGAIVRAAKALGYTRAFTYTLQSESGASLKASGWVLDKKLDTPQTWDRPGRRRGAENPDLFGHRTFEPAPRVRWRKDL